MHGFKSAILAKMKNCQNGTFEPVHEIQNFFWPKAFFWSIMKMAIRKNIHNLSRGPPNPGFTQEKVQKGDFLKKPLRELKKKSGFRFLWISWRPGTLNWERVVFLLSKILYRKCERATPNNFFSFDSYPSKSPNCLGCLWVFVPAFEDAKKITKNKVEALIMIETWMNPSLYKTQNYWLV